jgi:hypothetical protein
MAMLNNQRENHVKFQFWMDQTAQNTSVDLLPAQGHHLAATFPDGDQLDVQKKLRKHVIIIYNNNL